MWAYWIYNILHYLNVILRKITVRLNEKDYFDFLLESNERDNTVEEQIHEIIKYYIIIRRRRIKLKILSKGSLDSHMWSFTFFSMFS